MDPQYSQQNVKLLPEFEPFLAENHQFEADLQSLFSELEEDPIFFLPELEAEMETQDDRLTRNFRLREFASRGTAVPLKFLPNVKRVAQNLQVLRDILKVPIQITSGYRTPAHNRSVGGVPNSQHLTASAADIRVSGFSPPQIYCLIERTIRQGRMVEGGLGIYKRFVHYDVRGRRARWRGRGMRWPQCSSILRGIKRDGVEPISRSRMLTTTTRAASTPVTPPSSDSRSAGLPKLGGPKVPKLERIRIVKRHGVDRGLAGYGGGRLDEKLLLLKSRGIVSVSDEDIDTFQRIANIETGGQVQGINTWDSAVVSIGFMQWTLQHGKIQEWIKTAEFPFRRYGIELDGQRTYRWGRKRQIAIRGANNKSELRWNGWAERFFLAGLDNDVIAAEVQLAKRWLIRHLKGLRARLRKLGIDEKDYAIFKRHYDRSLTIRGIFQAAYNNLPAGATSGVRAALLATRKMGGVETSVFLQLLKNGIQKAFRARGYDGRGRNLTTKTLYGARLR